MDQKLSETDIKHRLNELDGWSIADGQLTKQFVLADFGAAMAFVNKVAQLAELASHHPDIKISYNKVGLALSTHSAGGLTDKDFELAKILKP